MHKPSSANWCAPSNLRMFCVVVDAWTEVHLAKLQLQAERLLMCPLKRDRFCIGMQWCTSISCTSVPGCANTCTAWAVIHVQTWDEYIFAQDLASGSGSWIWHLDVASESGWAYGICWRCNPVVAGSGLAIWIGFSLFAAIGLGNLGQAEGGQDMF